MNDHELTVMVDAAARGACNSYVAIHGGVLWEALDAATKNNYREAALPFIFHGSKALGELGYSKPRLVTTAEELDALDLRTVVRDGDDETWERTDNGWRYWVYDDTFSSREMTLPATVLHEPVSA